MVEQGTRYTWDGHYNSYNHGNNYKFVKEHEAEIQTELESREAVERVAYGGFDGWDIYRESRTNTDKFKANKYKGYVSHEDGATFGGIQNGDGLGLSGKTINSDY